MLEFCHSVTDVTSCRREAATICPHPGLQVVTRYTSYTHMNRSLTRCPCWPASTANQSGLVTWTSDLESGVRVACDVSYLCANLVFLDLSVLDLTLNAHRLMPPGGGIIIKLCNNQQSLTSLLWHDIKVIISCFFFICTHYDYKMYEKSTFFMEN